jgi:hypothetical protein
MTQAFNLSQLANNLDSSGRLDATDGLVNAVPVANGGTGASTDSAARTNLNVPTRTGGDASGTWAINITGNAATATNATNATFATTAGNGGVTSVNGSTGAVTVSTTPTTAQVLNATAGAAAGDVGTYAFARQTNTTSYAFGATIAGGSLSPAGQIGIFNFAATSAPTSSGTLSGTWRCMGYAPYASSCCGPRTTGTLWLRIS